VVRVALDLMGGDDAPVAVVDAALLVAAARPEIEVVLVGPLDVAERLLAARGASGRFALAAATEHVTMDEDGARAVRAKKDATVRVVHRLVRDGEADAAVSAGSTGAVLTAAVLTLGRTALRPALAVVVPTPRGPVVLLDAGATVEGSVEHLEQHARLGAAYAAVLGTDDPRTGLLNVGAEQGKGDQLRKDAFAALERAPLRFVGNVEGHDVVLGGKADVVVTDGFTGNVLLKGLEAALQLSGQQSPPVSAILLGVDGVSVVGHGAASAADIAACVEVAAQAVTQGLVARLAEALERQQPQGVTP
jgi:glycerol-3-phosphate acyltransferase PlsX